MQNTSLTLAVLRLRSKILIYHLVNSGFFAKPRLASLSLGCFA